MIAKIDSDSSRMRRWTPRKGGGSHPFDNDGGLLSVLFELNADCIAVGQCIGAVAQVFALQPSASVNGRDPSGEHYITAICRGLHDAGVPVCLQPRHLDVNRFDRSHGLGSHDLPYQRTSEPPERSRDSATSPTHNPLILPFPACSGLFVLQLQAYAARGKGLIFRKEPS